MSSFVFATIFSILVLRSEGREDTSPFLHIIPPAKVHFSKGSNSIHTGFLGVDLEEDGILRCV